MSDEAGEFLKKLGMKGEQPKDVWLELIRPSTVSLILGYKGTGKSGLGYLLLDKLSKAHSLLPIAVNLPREKRYLLPEHYALKSLEELKHTQDAVALIDEGTTMMPAGQRKVEELVKSFVALSRQRHQIIVFIFHSSSDVGSRILRGVDAILLKEPSLRQIQYGSKDNFCRALLTEAKERFKSLADMGEDTRKYTYVDCEKPPFRGMVKNDLPEYWTEDLSEAWADTANSESLFSRQSSIQETNEEYILRLRTQSTVVEGDLLCTLCGEGTAVLISDVCEPCFQKWALSTKRSR